MLLDLNRFSDVTVSNEGSSGTVSTGTRWFRVNQVLEVKKIVALRSSCAVTRFLHCF